jgi:hypothetical protein
MSAGTKNPAYLILGGTMQINKQEIAEIIQQQLACNEEKLSDGFEYYSSPHELSQLFENIAEKIVTYFSNGKVKTSASGVLLSEGENLEDFGMIEKYISDEDVIKAADQGHYIQGVVRLPTLEHTFLAEQYDLRKRLAEGLIGSRFLEDWSVEQVFPEGLHERGYIYYRVTGRPGKAAKEYINETKAMIAKRRAED